MRNRTKPTRFHVRAYPGELLGKFVSDTDAIRVAQLWSARWHGWAEVHYIGRHRRDEGAGIIAQFDKGSLTPEFAHVAKSIRLLDCKVMAPTDEA